MTAPTTPVLRADWRFALRSPWHLLATGFGSGLSPVAPGTAGSLFGWAVYALLLQQQPALTLWPLLLLGFAVGVPACSRAARALGTDDPSALVWDEVIGIWLVLALLPAAGSAPLWMQLLGFALFRLFDAVKRGPVGWVDRHLKGGWGIMLDDLVAALLAAAVLRAGLALGGAWDGL